MGENKNIKHLTRDAFQLADKKFDTEMEIYLGSLPYTQRQGVKGMLNFFNINSRSEVVKFIKENFSMKPTKNIVVNAIYKKLQSGTFPRDEDSKSSEQILEMCRFGYLTTTDIRVNEMFFENLNILSEKELEFRISSALYDKSELPIAGRFIDVALARLVGKVENDFIQEDGNMMRNGRILLGDVYVEECVHWMLGEVPNEEVFVKACLVTYGCKGRTDYFSFINDFRYIKSERLLKLCKEYVKHSKFRKIRESEKGKTREAFYEIIDSYMKK